MTRLLLALALATLPSVSGAQHSGNGTDTPVPSETGQSAFAALSEIVALLQADPTTDWTRVDIEALRLHLIDMDRVTLGSFVTQTDIPGGARFVVTGSSAEVIASIHRMTQAHAATMDGTSGWITTVETTELGAVMEVTDPTQTDAAMIRGLGFAGILTLGMHHPAHHLAIARGIGPHGH